MTHDPLPDLDRRLRETFEPDARVVARVMAGARTGEPPHRTRRRTVLGLAWAVTAAVIVVAGTTAYRHHRPDAQPAVEDALILSGSFTDDVLVVAAPDGSISLSGPGARDERPPDGGGIVLVEGDPE